MKDIFEQLKEAQNVRMTEAERAHMRQRLVSHMTSCSLVAERTQAQRSSWTTWGMFTRATAFILAGFIVGGTSLSFASLNTLPGDSLYPIKVGVTEKIGREFAFGTEAKARYNASLISARVAELDSLKQSGKIKNTTIAEVADASFTETFDSYQTSLETLAHEGRAARVQEIANGTLALLTPHTETATITNVSVGQQTNQNSTDVQAVPTATLATSSATNSQANTPTVAATPALMMAKMEGPQTSVNTRVQATAKALSTPIAVDTNQQTVPLTAEDRITATVSSSAARLQNIVNSTDLAPQQPSSMDNSEPTKIKSSQDLNIHTDQPVKAVNLPLLEQ
jgi:hypothetical protein